ncbi:hypothetical protein M413DRAFT_449740 [Hebeloma cylindrosporum]|uniref:Uncharacterized protein n=1 Tax=Hebeloma cylindrosporum TaxID=76867 RepID=A0A0C3BTM5_HEBCY|nr:hypothetical protein M413DRAFT_449740 [Hebeloma cylindrosporum h7]
MATPGALQIDDRNPLIYYSPNASWTRGGNASDYESTSTFTSTPGASASITFSGIGISVWGTIDRLDTPSFVLSSYSVDGGLATTHNATTQSQFQFQENFFQSGTLAPASHTLVINYLASGGRYFIDYFLVTPSNSPTSAATSPSPLSSSSSSSSALSTATTAAGAKAHVPIGAIVGGSIGGLAFIIIIAFVLWLVNRKLKRGRPDSAQPSSTAPFTPVSATEQYQPPSGTYNVSASRTTPSQFSYPTPSTPSRGIIPPSKTAQGAAHLSTHQAPFESASDSHTYSDSLDPPRYEG